jgi:solute carrier family 35 protein F1/2
MPPQSAPMLQPDGLSASESSDSGGMSIDSQDYQVKNKTYLSSMKCAISDGISRFFAQWRVLLLGQFLSILLASSVSFSSSMHVQCNVSAPAMQTAIVFFLMSFHVWPVLLRKRKENISTSNENDLALGESTSIDSSSEILRSTSTRSFGSKNVDESQTSEPHTICCRLISVSLPWWVYAGFACVLVEASFFTFLAYRYTSLTSASILDNTNIFAAMIGSRIILKRRYSTTHILGALICCIGVILNITSDVKKSGEDASVLDDDLERISVVEYPNRMFGDAMAILGGCMVGLCDVTIELIVKDFVSVDEYIGMFLSCILLCVHC